jgi:hypothetical protein
MARFGLALSACLLIGPSAFACSVPVFRYALERWQPSSYDLIVYHRGPLGTADREAVRRLEAAAARANARVTTADLAGRVDPDLLTVWDREGKEDSLPHVVLRYPDSGTQLPSVWAGPLSTDPVALLDSPSRHAVFDRLTAGHAGVVILLLSGDPEANRAARDFLRGETARIAGGIDVPPRTEDGPQVMSELPLWVSFPVVEVARTPAEDTLIRLLVGSEDGLAGVTGPIAFPVFGRGRALCSLHGKDLSDPTELRRSLEFLCRGCSCQVKELNPGVDLLMAANWDTIFDAERGPPARVIGPTKPPAAESHPASAAAGSAAELRSPPPQGYAAAELDLTPRERTSRTPVLRFGTLAAGLLVLVTGFWAFRSRRSPAPPASD